MKRGLSKGISLLTVMVMLMSLVPMGVLAVDTSVENKAVINQESPSMNNTETNAINSDQDVNISEGKLITTIDTEAAADPQKSETDRTIQTSETLPTSDVEGEGDYLYEDFDTGVSVYAYIGIGGNVVVPSTLGGKQVVKIGDWAFAWDNLTAITLPDSVTSIGERAFHACTSLTAITLPDSVTSIGDNTFAYCSSLTTITLPDSVTSIGDWAFLGCTSLTTISLPDSITAFGHGAFDGCSSLTAITLPVSVTAIGGSVFSGCCSLTAIALPDSVATIDDYAFYFCTGLTTITLPDGLTTIGDWAFSECGSLTKVVIPSSVTSIGDSAFFSSPVTIFGVKGSYAETYANTNGIPFIAFDADLGVASFTTDKASGQNINTIINLTATGSGGKTPYQFKFYYKLGTTTVLLKDFSATNTAVFKPATAGNYTLMVDIRDANGKIATQSKAMQITDGTTPEPAFLSFIGKDPSGGYYQYKVADFNNAYLAYQINPGLSAAKMYQQFLTSQCRIIALEDAAKGYLDYGAAANACLLAQLKGESFDILAYFASDDAKLLEETVTNVKIVDKNGNIN